MTNNPPIHKRIELLFDAVYMASAVMLGIGLIASGSQIQGLWGAMGLVLVGGDAFHLIPRMAAAYTGDKARFEKTMGIGKMLTSVTMTLFYLMLWCIGLELFKSDLPIATMIIFILAIVRIALCLLPQNGWISKNPSYRWGIYRNIPFVIQGTMVLVLFAANATHISVIRFMWLAILLSFAFYLPVVLWSSKKPKLGMLMLPKACAYIWILSMGFWV